MSTTDHESLAALDDGLEPDATTFEAAVQLADQEDDHAPPDNAPGAPLFTTPYAESKVNSETPQLRKSALARVDKRTCVMTQLDHPVVQVAHIVRRSVNQNILLKFRKNGVIFDVHSRKNLMTPNSLERMTGYLEHTQDPTYLGMWTSANVEDPTHTSWYTYELATFPGMDVPIVRRKKPKYEDADSSHAAFTTYLPVGDLEDEDTQTTYRSPDGSPFPTFRHHAHPWVMTITAGLRYRIHERQLTSAQRFRYDGIRKFHRLWTAKVKAIQVKDGENPEEENKSKDGTDGDRPNPLEEMYPGIQGPDPKTPTKRRKRSEASNPRGPGGDTGQERPTKRTVTAWGGLALPALNGDTDMEGGPGFDPITNDLLEALQSHAETENWVDDLDDTSVFTTDSIGGDDGMELGEPDGYTPSLTGSADGRVYVPPQVETPAEQKVETWLNNSQGELSNKLSCEILNVDEEGEEWEASDLGSCLL
ncbi:hypothetical protein CALCODRAFT_510473 [Calocera cornea HHB12733]|uniref:Uncharacterized protein n=1 Tax=Calocera cornea HHB12733 TaxID=1353952 RepID=A0A165EHQ8_9BASI|nr:hypothetical protein CALCODRAFT_510473 [Calocera cornea HHB12733]